MTTSRQPETGDTPFGIYVHWPFCEAKCPYCDFNSYARRTVGEERYLAACLSELAHYAALTQGREVASIFLGGGTPSLMSAQTVGAILDRIAGLWPLAGDAEVTLEANPSSVEAARFAGYRAAGVNRVSIGVQSLSDEALRFLGRLHDREAAVAAVRMAARHFDRYSFDLIYARPGQTPAEWARELGEALAMAGGHLSLYQLTIEPGTAFFELERRGKLFVPEGDAARALYLLTQEMCEGAGLPAYEISNHAAPGHASRHNLIYWRYGDYAGIGPGAHGRLSLAGEGKTAFSAIRDPRQWVEAVETSGCGAETREALSRHEQAVEMLLMGLRLEEGLAMPTLRRKTGHDIRVEAITDLVADGLIEWRADGGIIRPTLEGRLLLDRLVERIASHLREEEQPGEPVRPLASMPVA